MIPAANKYQTFAEAFHAVRVSRALSFREIADQAGVSRSEVKDWEDGKALPSTVQFKRIAGVMRALIPYAYLLPREAPRHHLAFGETEHSSAPLELLIDAVEPAAAVADAGPPEEIVEAAKPTSFGEALRAARIAEGLSQFELGELLSVADQAVSSWECGHHAPILSHLEQLDILFPALKDGPRPPSRDQDKPIPGPRGDGPVNPGGGAGRANSVEVALTAPRLSAAPPPAKTIADLGAEYAGALAAHRRADLAVEAAEEQVRESKRLQQEAAAAAERARVALDQFILTEVR